MANYGSFGSAIGGGSAISAALQRRRTGDSVSPLSQVSGAAPSFSGAAPMPPTPAPQGTMPTGTPMGAPTAVGPVEKSETELIINALGERLKSISKVELAKVSPPTPPTPAPTPAPALGGV